MANSITVSFYLTMVSEKNRKLIKDGFEYLGMTKLNELVDFLKECDTDINDEDAVIDILDEWSENKFMSINNR